MPHSDDPRRQYVLYDERAALGDTDDAAVLCCADSLTEARRDKRAMFPNAVIYEYDVAEDGKTLLNERQVP